jgi:hypothetical protein
LNTSLSLAVVAVQADTELHMAVAVAVPVVTEPTQQVRQVAAQRVQKPP